MVGRKRSTKDRLDELDGRTVIVSHNVVINEDGSGESSTRSLNYDNSAALPSPAEFALVVSHVVFENGCVLAENLEAPSKLQGSVATRIGVTTVEPSDAKHTGPLAVNVRAWRKVRKIGHGLSERSVGESGPS